MEFTEEMIRHSLQILDAEEVRARSVLANLEQYPPGHRRTIERAFTRSLSQIAVRQRMLKQLLND